MADGKRAAADGTVEAWGRGETNPVGGWYGLVAGQHIHGEPWRAIRNETDVDAGWRGRRMPKKASMYIVWTYGLLLFGVAAVVVGVLAIVAPDAL